MSREVEGAICHYSRIGASRPLSYFQYFTPARPPKSRENCQTWASRMGLGGIPSRLAPRGAALGYKARHAELPHSSVHPSVHPSGTGRLPETAVSAGSSAADPLFFATPADFRAWLAEHH